MSILYLHTAPLPKIQGTDAVFNEVRLLKSHFSGFEFTLYPFKSPSSKLPRSLYGWHLLVQLKRLQEMVSLNHIYSPGLHYYPVLKYLKKPVIYSVSAAVTREIPTAQLHRLQGLNRIIISNDRDYRILRHLNFDNLTKVRPGIDTRSISKTRLPLQDQLILLLASAPWETSQFKTKGVDLLLEAARELPYLKLIFLWRGSLLPELKKKISYYAVGKQVEVINEWVEVNEVLKRVHGSVLLAGSADLVKAYPHSLVESLAGAKPLIISSCIAMADYVQDQQCGVVVNQYNLSSLIGQIDLFRQDYTSYCQQAERVGAGDFLPEKMISEVSDIYQSYEVKPMG